MQKALHIRTTVQPGGKVEFASPELDAGQTVDVVVLHESNAKGRLSWKSSTAVPCAAFSRQPKR